jgi:hypothetical protein
VAIVLVPDFAPRWYSRTMLVLLVLLSAAVVAELRLDPPVSCQHHAGPFSVAFSAQFDINRVDCRVPGMKRLPTVHFWGGPPYVSIDYAFNPSRVEQSELEPDD